MRALAAATVVLCAPPAGAAGGAPNTTALGIDAYTYLYPLVLTDATRSSMGGAILHNRFISKTAFPAPGPGPVVSPNVDTLYSIAWLQLTPDRAELMSLPDTGGRYYVMQLIDAWTNTFASPGKRTTGTTAQQFAIVGPGYTGDTPPNVTVIRSPTSTVWVLGRTQTNGAADIPNVTKLQKGYTLSPITSRPAPRRRAAAALQSGPPPPAKVAAMDAPTFFAKAAELMQQYPPPAADAAIVASLAAIGLVPGQAFDWGALPSGTQGALQAAVPAAQAALATFQSGTAVKRVNGWVVPPADIGGPYGTDYATRAGVAFVGLGANQQDDAVYWSTGTDADGAPLSGGSTYAVRFAPGQLPPVRAFWSLTLYDADHYLVPNAANVYAVGDRDALVKEDDGSLVITIAADRPPQPANWLPAPAGAPFNLNMRLYWPSQAILNGTWVVPGVRKAA